ncbi:MAG: RelB antitoxin [Verrucomicrobiota bacterium]|jgi:DNA-damage-inducible protein J
MLKAASLVPTMATTTKTLVRARVDGRRKVKAEQIFKRYGLTTSEAVNVFLAKVEEVNGMPFDLRPTEPITPPKNYVGKFWDSLDT